MAPGGGVAPVDARGLTLQIQDRASRPAVRVREPTVGRVGHEAGLRRCLNYGQMQKLFNRVHPTEQVTANGHAARPMDSQISHVDHFARKLVLDVVDAAVEMAQISERLWTGMQCTRETASSADSMVTSAAAHLVLTRRLASVSKRDNQGTSTYISYGRLRRLPPPTATSNQGAVLATIWGPTSSAMPLMFRFSASGCILRAVIEAFDLLDTGGRYVLPERTRNVGAFSSCRVVEVMTVFCVVSP